ncbi:MAG: rhodanese-like domain-containing protein [Chloroflexi bacterium]|nr:rhodanese-like domain-containing protein [Chloroflexota bacterium]
MPRTRRSVVFAGVLGPWVAGCGVSVRDPSEGLIVSRAVNTAPKSDDEVTRVTALDAFNRVQAGKATLYDTRGAEYFSAGHAKGAINLPVADIERDPTDARRRMVSGTLAVFYCT